MAVTAYWYAKGFLAAFNKEVDFAADAIKVALTTSTYTPDQDAHDYFDDVTNEVVGDGYVAGGHALGTPSIANTENVIKLDGDDTVWEASTITARRAVVYDSTPGTAATNPLLTWVDFGADEVSTAGDFTITWHANGIATITAANAA
ncbi:MAG TPA: hypothetical protein VMY35_08240 [Phycisphaerae bacterium]|nr:hypothetical protein [Phycisphaerae bacterium]